MNKDLQNLIEVSQIDKKASSLEPEIKVLEDELEQALISVKVLEDELENIINGIKKTKVDIASNELMIKDNNEKIEQIDKKMLSVKSERERKALDTENSLAREQITFANEEINKLENSIGELREREKALQDEITQAKDNLEEVRNGVETKQEDINEKLRKIFTKKEKLSKKIDHKVVIFYEKIRKWAKDTSVVPVKKQACWGCFMKINDKVYSEIKKSEDMVTCPHCGRILYIP